MRVKLGPKYLVGLSIAAALTGCASEENLRLLREPPLPPVAVTRAATTGPLWRNVSIQSVEGAPEFRWFDGGAILTTRPTRKQALDVFSDDLDKVGMLSSSRIESGYMLYVKFEDLHGPDVVLFSDKHASAVICFRLVNWRTGRVVRESRIIAAYEADLGGITPEEVRSIFGPIGLANDNVLGIGRPGEDVVVRYVLTTSKGTPISQVAQIGPLNGTNRRISAWHGLLNLAFDEFMNELSNDGSVVFKQAVSCNQIMGYTPPGFSASRQGAELVETDQSYAVDCKNSNYMESITHRVFSNKF